MEIPAIVGKEIPESGRVAAEVGVSFLVGVAEDVAVGVKGEVAVGDISPLVVGVGVP
jgi:hypothetical protein